MAEPSNSAAAGATAPLPAAAGFRWPAEWEPHAATWLAWPHNPDTWPGRLEFALSGFVEIVRALQGREVVRIVIADEAMEAAARSQLRAAGIDPDAGIEFPRFATDDSWLRDTAPIFAVRDAEDVRERAALSFRFDSWGGKYPPWDRDAKVSAGIAELAGVARFDADFVLEGGSVDGNGLGSLLTTESCLLNQNRERGRTREAMEARLRAWLGATNVLWLGDGIEGDDTDGHVDDITRFVGPATLVTAVADSAGDRNARPLAQNLARLRTMSDQDGRRLDVIELPMPREQRVNGQVCPASHANFYIANGAVLVPTFGGPSDARACAILGELLPDRDVVGIPCRDLVYGLGAVHCLSQQEPATEATPPARKTS